MSETEFKDYVKYDLLNEFEWLKYNYLMVWIVSGTGNHLIVDLNSLGVNYWWWNKGVLEGHPTFIFDGGPSVKLTPDNYEEFKQVLHTYSNVIDNFWKHQCCRCGTEDTQYYDDDGYSYCTKCKNETVKTRIEDLLNT